MVDTRLLHTNKSRWSMWGISMMGRGCRASRILPLCETVWVTNLGFRR